MIRISIFETTYEPAEDEETDYCPDGRTHGVAEDKPVTFRELVGLLREFAHHSCHPAQGETFEWLSTNPEQDYMTGEWTERTIHFSHKNRPHQSRYWRLAMKAAGFVR